MSAFLAALNGFLLQLSANLTLEWSGRSMFHPLSHIYAKTFFLLRWNSCKQCSKSLTHCCFWSTVSKRGTHFEHSFLLDKCSCKMVDTLPSDIFNSSATLLNFNLRLAKTSLSFFMFSRMTAKFGRPEHSASFVSVRLHLKSAYHLLTIASNGTESK